MNYQHVQDIIKKYISTLTLEDMNNVEVMVDDCMSDCLYLCELLYIHYYIHINPMHAYWFWKEFSVSWDAQWMIISKNMLDTALEVTAGRWKE
jgi:hypothetical protein